MSNLKTVFSGIIATVLTLGLASFAQAEDHAKHSKAYKIDASHSNVNFKIRHFFTPVSGNFGSFEGSITYDEAHPEKSSTSAKLKVSSINTNDKKRDAHLMNEDFFLESDFPEITFESTSWDKVGDNKFKINGNLTMLDKTLPVTLETELLGIMDHPRQKGKKLSGWTARATIDRRDWGITYGQGIVGNDVEIEINIEGIE